MKGGGSVDRRVLLGVGRPDQGKDLLAREHAGIPPPGMRAPLDVGDGVSRRPVETARPGEDAVQDGQEMVGGAITAGAGDGSSPTGTEAGMASVP